jgi:transcriptional regulator with XRE-family HTH domain
MVGGLARSRPPRELAHDPKAWPDAEITDPAAAVVQHIARATQNALGQLGLSLRQAADNSGVNRQVIANLVAGRTWPDVATIARLENFLAMPLYPTAGGTRFAHEDRPSRPQQQQDLGTTK